MVVDAPWHCVPGGCWRRGALPTVDADIDADIDNDAHADVPDRRAGGAEPARGSLPTSAAVSAAAAAAFALALSPIAVAAASVVGDTWHPTGDFAGLWFRVSQVGTLETPLVGAESIKGFAHPGPLALWLAAPLQRLTGDPRSLIWTAALLNGFALTAVAAVAWRRGRWPLLLGTALLVAVLVSSLRPETLVTFWNPYLPLVPFLAVLFLVWDIALGQRRSIVPAALVATLAAQTHLAFVFLLGLVLFWLVAWSFLWPRIVPAAGDGPMGLSGLPGRDWLRALRPGLVVIGVLSVPMLADALFDLHNPIQILRTLSRPELTVGPADSISVVGRYVRPDGPWMGGAEPAPAFNIEGSGPLPLLGAIGVLGACTWVARRRRLADVAALSTLALVLVIGAVPATSQIVRPLYPYLTQPLKVIGGFVWFTVGWTVWRAVVEPHVRTVRARRLVGAAAAATLVAVSASTWPDAARIELPLAMESAAAQALRAELGAELDDVRLRVEYRGDPLNQVGPGVIGGLIEDGFDLTTSDGSPGLKWGHRHRFTGDDPYDMLLTVAVHLETDFHNAFRECADDDATLVAEYDSLAPADRRFLEDVQLRLVTDPERVGDADRRRLAEISAGGLRVGVFVSDEVCATNGPRS